MRRRAKPVQPDASRIVAGHAQCSKADQSRAEQRRRFGVGIALGNAKTVASIGNSIFGIAAVDLVPGKARRGAEVFLAAAAKLAFAAGPSEPGNADPIAERKIAAASTERDDITDDLVTEHERQFRFRQLSIDDVKVGAANPARCHADQRVDRAVVPVSADPRLAAVRRRVEEPGHAWRSCPMEWSTE